MDNHIGAVTKVEYAPSSHFYLQDQKRPETRWKTTFYRLLQQITVKDPRRLVLKSPPHTCRIPTLLDLFPDARFVHIVRDPSVVYPSTLHLWRVTYGINGLQKPSWAELPEYILDTFVQVYDRLEEGKRLIPPGRIHELH